MIFHAVFQRHRFGREEDYIESDSEEDSDDESDSDSNAAAENRRRLLGIHARKYLSHFSDAELLHIREFFEFYNSAWYWLSSIVAAHSTSSRSDLPVVYANLYTQCSNTAIASAPGS